MKNSNEIYKCLVVDDDEAARLTLENYIKKTANLLFAGSLEDGSAVFNFLLENHDIDILFLDIHMPEMSGIDLLKSVPNLPATVLTTSNPEFALEAYEHQVVDYLIKPIQYSRFVKSVSKIASLHEVNKEKEEDFYIKVNQKMVRLKPSDILYIEALSEYVVFVTASTKHIVYSSITAVEEKLNDDFMRIHRSHVVNLKKIEVIEDNSVVIQGKHFPISKTYMADFFARINKF